MSGAAVGDLTATVAATIAAASTLTIEQATSTVLLQGEKMPEGSPTVRGIDFNEPVTLDSLMASMFSTGFQATNIALAVDEINKMIRWRLSDEPVKEDEDDDLKDPEVRSKIKCTIFLGYTSNMISCGMREVLKFLVQHKMVDCIVTSAGGIEEDFMKCLAPHYIGDFSLKGTTLRKKGINRIGNLLVPNSNYCVFEDFFTPILEKMHDEQDAKGVRWTPSKIINRLGKEIDNPDSVYYWCYRNNIPVFCPALTDGSLGDMLYFHSYHREGFILDLVGDIRGLNDIALAAKHTGMLILGGGVIKHHICNANLMRNGADFSVFINTASDYDGSDAGAKPDEAVSWGKIKMTATPVKIYAEVTTVFPLIVSQTFAKHAERLTHEGVPAPKPYVG